MKVWKMLLTFLMAMMMGALVAGYIPPPEDESAKQGVQCGQRCCNQHPTDPTKCQDCCDPCCVGAQSPKRCTEVCYGACINCP
jgi:hypothetical protein